MYQIAQNFSPLFRSGGDYMSRIWAETKDCLVNICYYPEVGFRVIEAATLDISLVAAVSGEVSPPLLRTIPTNCQ
jgi:hypothetical protein